MLFRSQEHTVSCCIKGLRESKSDFIEPDERVNIKSFYRGTTKLSLGLFSDIPDEWDKTPDGIMDYWTEYLMKYASRKILRIVA